MHWTTALGPCCCTKAHWGWSLPSQEMEITSHQWLVHKPCCCRAAGRGAASAGRAACRPRSQVTGKEGLALGLHKREFAHLSSPNPALPQPLCQGKAAPCSLPFQWILLLLPHFCIWDAALAAGRMGWLLNPSSLPLLKCFTICTNTP